jgi:hypothetical protein
VAAASTGAPPRPRRFEFVRNAELRPVLERAFDDSRDAFERGEFALALVLSCSVIESLLTDALSAGSGQPAAGSATTDDHRGGPSGPPSFEQRIAQAEKSGIIRRGCARLPAVARTYHNLADEAGELRAGVHVTEREARLAGQVLRVVMRDLDPGR